MLSKRKTVEALDEMAALFPNAQCELLHRNVFQLLIATLLSAQATDVSVNKVTPSLFDRFPTPEAFVAAPLESIMQEIRTIGLYRTKAANIQKCCKMLLEDFGGEVPRTLEELTKLPGVGRKTANVVMSGGFHIPAIAVDTHVERISKRLRIAPQKASVLEVEELLMKKIPKERWSDAHHQMIFFGRYHCTARNPKCEVCPLLSMCQEGQKRLGLK
ncbi:endonuclease III [uncultured Trichococcus sp.]|uniref:endonuclease III n=1 Tax=uncultured Trichococcus sp. TaxID=189665 RepID=UPI0025936CA4|nr:endonuclease III [uncultured Trichococcus sp.]HRF52679.1 endonuclease III [Trichococcus flocculiformis]